MSALCWPPDLDCQAAKVTIQRADKRIRDIQVARIEATRLDQAGNVL